MDRIGDNAPAVVVHRAVSWKITADETDENTRGEPVQKIQAMKAADFLRSMAVALDGYAPEQEE